MRHKWVCKQIAGEFKLIPIDEYVGDSHSRSYQVLEDTIPLTWHPATGEHCSSRTGMIKIAKAQGLEELGNDRIPKKKVKVDRNRTIEVMKDHYERIRNRSA